MRMLALGAASVIALGACTGQAAVEQPTQSATPSTTTTTDADLAAYYTQSVRWEGCEGDFDCTRIKVPLDYEDPSGASIELDVVRLKARRPQGSLLLNPGGPGGSGVEYARAARVMVSEAVRRQYDIVGFDPRGVVGSEPVDCMDDAQIDVLLAADGTPDDEAEIQQVADLSAQIGAGCKARSPEIAAHMDSASVVRDMDIVRAVLGDDKLNWLGKSYGTFLGAMYADLFPERVGRVVLDGVLPSSLDVDEITLGQAKAFDVALTRFVAYCIEQEECPLPRDVEAGVARIQQLLADLDAQPLPGMGDRLLTEALATSALVNSMYVPPTDWDMLSYGLLAAFEGDGSVLMEMVDERLGRGADGRYSDNGNESFYAVGCLDRPALGGVEHAASVAEDWAREAPVFGVPLAWGNLPCWQWPFGPGTAQAAGELPVARATGSDPILVVSTRYDPATPYEWGVQVAGELDNATLLTYEGDGHTAYASGSSCVDAAVDGYLLDGVLPEEGTVCGADW